ncbi:RHS repeat protein, partial [Escherichia coli]|uniref:RHS repeat protein n=1 Tax=Escherichia coli TaxID=562 RepID=UPI001ADB620A
DAAGRVIRLTSENGSHTTFRYDVLDRLIQETGFDGRTHRYHYDSQHRLVHYTRTQYAEPLVESRYLYDPLGR